MIELKGSESAANSAIKNIKGSGPSAVEQVTVIIRKQYERPGGPEANDAARIEKAVELYEKYKGGAATETATDNSDDTCTESTSESSASGDSTGDFAWPVAKPGQITTCYDYSRGRLHSGLDISAPKEAKVAAADGGAVELVKDNGSSGYGKVVIIKHNNGKWTLYAHLNSIDVKQGDKVDKGQRVGGVGNTGASRGDHLHFNIQTKGGEQSGEEGTVDPLKYLPKDGRQMLGSGCPRNTV